MNLRGPALIAGRVVVGLVSVAVLTATGVTWSTYRQLKGIGSSHAISKDSPKSQDGAQNILVIGLTNRTDKDGNQLSKDLVDALHAGDGHDGQGGYNTNTMIILHVPNDGSKKVQGISVPRDDYVTFVDSAQRAGTDFDQPTGKIKQAYGLAREWKFEELVKQGVKDKATLEQQAREAGRTSTIANLEHLLNIKIDHFAEVSLVSFYRLAEYLGGIDVCLKEATHDTNAGANFKKGEQHLNAAQALAFVRQRDNLTNNDLDRTHRQQAFIAAVTHKLKTDGVFGNLSKLQGLLNVAREQVVIDADWDLLSFAQQAQNLTGGNVEFNTLPIKGYRDNPLIKPKEQINVIDIPELQAEVRMRFSPAKSGTGAPATTTEPAITGSGSTVDVHNGSTESGLGPKVADALASRGFSKGKFNSVAAQENTRILYGAGAQEDAEKVAQLLGGFTATASPQVAAGHVSVTLGVDFMLPDRLSPGPATTTAATTRANTSAPGTPATTTEAPNGEAVSGNGVPCVY